MVVALALALSLTSCYTPEGRGALYGATAGAVVGNLVNPQASTTLRGAALGAGIGALLGALVGRPYREPYYPYHYDAYPGYYRHYSRRYDQGYYPRPSQGYPVGEPASAPGFVRSPYPPNNVIDVRGIPSGSLVVDPSTDMVFRTP